MIGLLETMLVRVDETFEISEDEAMPYLTTRYILKEKKE